MPDTYLTCNLWVGLKLWLLIAPNTNLFFFPFSFSQGSPLSVSQSACKKPGRSTKMLLVVVVAVVVAAADNNKRWGKIEKMDLAGGKE